MPEQSLLGRPNPYPSKYSPELLVPIPRAEGRARLGLGGKLPFSGADVWTAYELSWLDRRGKPVVAIGELRFPAETLNIVESKSLKLYLNSLNGMSFDNIKAVRVLIENDLVCAAGGAVSADIRPLVQSSVGELVEFSGTCIDELDVTVTDYEVNPDLLRLDAGIEELAEETLHSHLFKTNCPVTAQPDWASVMIRYQGRAIDHRALLLYLISYRNYAAFHEDCVERIFMDLSRCCEPHRLSVYARYTRRGGIDINPFRSNFEPVPRSLRLRRQ
jgi:7-cyano-7-deazaguanine reductase